jgi:hypothetical protein
MKKKLLSIALAGLFMASCSDWLDINQDPNNPASVTPDLVLPQAELALANTYAGTMYNHAGFIIQYFDQRVGAPNYRDYTQFKPQATNGNRAYTDMYNLCLVNAEYVRTESEKNESWGNYLAATVIKAYALQSMVDLFGEVPYTEALQGGDNAQPHYDEGQVVYDGILAELEDAIDKVSGSSALVTGNNLLFGATNPTAKWLAFAKAVKLRILMRQASINWDGVKVKVNALIAENNFPAADVAFTCWVDAGTKRNPWYTDAAIFLSKADHMAAAAYINTLSAYGDPRLDARYDLPQDGSVSHRGGVPGIEYDPTSDPGTVFSTPKFIATAPAYLITLAEIEFFKAEAAFRNGQLADARQAYEDAIDASFAQAKVTGASNLYGAGKPYEWSDASGLEKIAFQKWIALGCVNNFESWCEVRRLGTPGFCSKSADEIASSEAANYETGKLIFPKGAPAEIPTNTLINRFYYPVSSSALNPNVPESKKLSTKIFWQP